MPPKTDRQTLMFSATFPQGVQTLAAEFLNDHVFITVGKLGAANTDIRQELLKVGQYEKKEKLIEFILTDMQNFKNEGKFFLSKFSIRDMTEFLFFRRQFQQENARVRRKETRRRFRRFVFVARRSSDH